ncbi:aminopeptidase [Salinispira pacifica]
MKRSSDNAVDRFGTAHAGVGELMEPSRTAVEKVLGITEGEKVLIVTNPVPDVSDIAMAIYDAAAEAGASPVLLYQPRKSQLDFAEPAVVEAIRSRPDVLVSMSAGKLGKDREAILKPLEANGRHYDNLFHYLLYGERSIRSFWSPGVTREIWSRTVAIDYDELRFKCDSLRQLLDHAASVHITTQAGTDLTIGLAGRNAFVDDGDFTRPGLGGNLPAGEAYISPQLGTSEGVIVFDGSIASYSGTIRIHDPIRVEVRAGFVTDVSGGVEADELADTLRRAEDNTTVLQNQAQLSAQDAEIYRRNVRNLGELGIGMNPKARITGNMLEDEKAFRTCHIAIGHNYDEDAPALTHLDGVIRNPTIEVMQADGARLQLMQDGEFTS